jgi:hypothetical protein
MASPSTLAPSNGQPFDFGALQWKAYRKWSGLLGAGKRRLPTLAGH